MGQEVFKQMLREKGLKVTAQRMLVLEIMAAHPGEHLTAEEIFDLARQAYPEIGLATIYRTLLVLVELQIIDKISLDDGFARYELGRKPGSDEHHHHHAICMGCKTVFSLEEDLLDDLEQNLKERLGFEVTDHEVKLYGYCRACRDKRGSGSAADIAERGGNQ
ncbi:MAG: transcriptional repressor [Hungatella sp.]|nr:transcriptional repressor [Hungatella sp.]